MGKVIMSGIVPQLVAPTAGLLLSDLAEGSVVKINENGSPVEFYVAQHNYEFNLNRASRTLLVRKDCYDERQWHSSEENTYSGSDIDNWLNGDYKGLLDANVQSAIGTTSFYNTENYDSGSVVTLGRAVFLLSLTELGISYGNANTEGSALSIAATLQIAYYNGSAVGQWTRSPYMGTTPWNALAISESGEIETVLCSGTRGARPCFTLPNTAVFDEDTLVFKGLGSPVSTIPVYVTVSDDAGYLSTLLDYGELTVGGEVITTDTSTIEAKSSSIEVSFKLNTGLSKGRYVEVNGTEIGIVQEAGSSVSTTVDVSENDTITIVFSNAN